MGAPTTHGAAGPGAPHAVEVADRVFAYVQPDGSWWVNNTGFLVGGDAVTAIDATSTERRTRALLDAIAAVTPAPVRTLVNTHHHGDHTNGNCLFDEAVVLGHDNCREEMRHNAIGGIDAVFGPVDWGDLVVRPPDVTFAVGIDLHSAETRVELRYVGTPAHTTGDAYAWLPEHRVLFAGDLVFNGVTPFVLMGSVAGSIDALAHLRALGAAIVVPGHGGVCDASVYDRAERYLRFVEAVAAEGIRAGLSPLEAARECDLGEFGAWLDRERIVGNLHRAYAEAQPDAERGARLDVLAAFADMIAFNGGRPLRCRA